MNHAVKTDKAVVEDARPRRVTFQQASKQYTQAQARVLRLTRQLNHATALRDMHYDTLRSMFEELDRTQRY